MEIKLKKMLSIITGRFDEMNIPFAAIGAMALSAYGLPRFTADIDLLAENGNRSGALKILRELGYTCFQESDSFAQLDSEMGVFGKVDLMFVSTQAGKEILQRRTLVSDDLMGNYPVIQPSDYIILKLMAAANDPTRQMRDDGDISAVLKQIRHQKLPKIFEPIQRERILDFAGRFRAEKRMKQLLKEHLDATSATGNFFL